MPERALVCFAGRSKESPGGLAQGIQRESPSQCSQRVDPSRIRPQDQGDGVSLGAPRPLGTSNSSGSKSASGSALAAHPESTARTRGAGYALDFWHEDVGVSGKVPAARRPAFAALLNQIRKG